ncbi:hypothetical protein GLOIN_2v1761212 [Rhizophagus irregularis DAOM 181602=DAOM 197198]|nr:hypothetical protein GLOIN_2v1761212 [Rhizophagus irregularis DAOM 181602=DAOM 197198]
MKKEIAVIASMNKQFEQSAKYRNVFSAKYYNKCKKKPNFLTGNLRTNGTALRRPSRRFSLLGTLKGRSRTPLDSILKRNGVFCPAPNNDHPNFPKLMEPPKKKIFYFDKDNLIIEEYQGFGSSVSVLALRFPYDWMEFRRFWLFGFRMTGWNFEGFRLFGFRMSGWNFEDFWLPRRHFEGPEHQSAGLRFGQIYRKLALNWPIL